MNCKFKKQKSWSCPDLNMEPMGHEADSLPMIKHAAVLNTSVRCAECTLPLHIVESLSLKTAIQAEWIDTEWINKINASLFITWKSNWTLSLTLAFVSLVNFQIALKMKSYPSVVAGKQDSKIPKLYYQLASQSISDP